MALKVRQLREESTARLREILAETQEKMHKHRLRIASGEGVNPHEGGEMRRDIARVKTLLHAVALVAQRSGADEEVARASLDQNGWSLSKAVAAAKTAAEPAR